MEWYMLEKLYHSIFYGIYTTFFFGGALLCLYGRGGKGKVLRPLRLISEMISYFHFSNLLDLIISMISLGFGLLKPLI